MNNFKEVSRFYPCPICGKPDWCSVSLDGNAICCRRGAAAGGIPRTDRNGVDYWLFFEEGLDFHSTPHVLQQEKEVERADVETLHRVYSEILKKFYLISHHRTNLLERGLTAEEIERRNYGSLIGEKRWETVKKIVADFGPDICARVPGLIVKEGKFGPYWTVSGMNGILIPVRDFQKRIVALKIRLDEPDDSGKYRYVSSKSHHGPGSGTHVHVPLYTKEIGDVVRVTEGELKADIATFLSGTLTLSVPGVSAWRMAMPLLKQLKPKTVSIAFDSDAQKNITVANCLVQFATEIRRKNYELQVEQ